MSNEQGQKLHMASLDWSPGVSMAPWLRERLTRTTISSRHVLFATRYLHRDLTLISL
jgi:hypothetical protein